MLEIALHGFGNDAKNFQLPWPPPPAEIERIFLDAPHFDLFSGGRRWFSFTGDSLVLARGLESAADALEERIATLAEQAASRSIGGLCLTGHSQGAMLVLALAARGSMALSVVHSYAGYLPLVFPVSSSHRPQPVTIHLYSSRSDPYVRTENVAITASRLAVISGHNVIHHVADGLPHAFSSEWLNPYRFVEVEF
ncbi:MAG: alpha/beta hydrolase [Cyanobacteriota bacterium]|jgi:predicted esterase